MAKQISRINYGFIPGNAIGLVTLTRDASNPRRPYILELSYRHETNVFRFRSGKHAIRAFRGDSFKRRHGFEPAAMEG